MIMASISMKTLLEPADIEILRQDRLKVRETNLIPAICFYNGTFVPIHAGHINALEAAKRYIENLGTHEFLGAYISPSHSGYVAKKLKPEQSIGAGHRLSMITLAIENLDWVMIDLFEMFQPYKTKLSITMHAFAKRVHSQLSNGADIDIFWIKGEDALFYIRPPDDLIQLGYQNLYVLNRESNHDIITEDNKTQDSQDSQEKIWNEIRTLSSFPEKFHLTRTTPMNLSSSSIRACACNSSCTYEQLQACVQLEKVTNYIIQHQLWNPKTVMIETLTNFPTNITDITSDTLSHMFSTYSNSSVKVKSFLSKQIGIGQGWNGLVYRLYNIEYSSDTTKNLPLSVVVKISSGIWLARIAAVEPEFYVQLKPQISNIEIPECYYAARHPSSSNKSLLLLEDLSVNYDRIGSKQSFSDSKMFLLVASIASLHAEFFNHPWLKRHIFAWLPSLNSTMTHYQTEYTKMMINKEFTQLLEAKVSGKAYNYAKALVNNIPHIFQELSEKYYTLSHGDLWINNVFQQRDQSHRLSILDWQTCYRANGLIDVVFFLRLLHYDRCRSIEPICLELYHKTLVKYGVSCYQLSDICDDYYLLALPFMFVLFACLHPLKDSKFQKLLLMLEDIVTYAEENKRTKCDYETLAYE